MENNNNNNREAEGGGIPVEQWYWEIPPVSRFFGTAAVLTTLACQLELVSPFHLYFNYKQIIHHRQYYRLVTNFFYFGSFGLDFLFYLFFMMRYCRMLEEGSFRGRTADFVWMLLLGAIALTMMAPFVNIMFLGSSLTFMMVYLWSRRNPDVRLNFLGFFNFNAPYLPWVLLGFSLLIGHVTPTQDLLGIVIGHVYYFLEDVYPHTSGTGVRYMKAPEFLKRLIEPPALDDLQQPENAHPHQD